MSFFTVDLVLPHPCGAANGFIQAQLPTGEVVTSSDHGLGGIFESIRRAFPEIRIWVYRPVDPTLPAQVFSAACLGYPGRRFRILGAWGTSEEEAQRALPQPEPGDNPFSRRLRHLARVCQVKDAAMRKAEALVQGDYTHPQVEQQIRRFAGVMCWAEAHAVRSDGRSGNPRTHRPEWWPRSEGARDATGNPVGDYKGRRRASNGGAWTAAAEAAAMALLGSGPRDNEWAASLCVELLRTEGPEDLDLAAEVGAAVLDAQDAQDRPWSGDLGGLVDAWLAARGRQQEEEVKAARKYAGI